MQISFYDITAVFLSVFITRKQFHFIALCSALCLVATELMSSHIVMINPFIRGFRLNKDILNDYVGINNNNNATVNKYSSQSDHNFPNDSGSVIAIFFSFQPFRKRRTLSKAEKGYRVSTNAEESMSTHTYT